MDRSPAPRSTTAYAVLGLLALRDWTTYELAKQMQRSLHWFWPRAERKLYDEPKRLVEDGLATATAEATGKRPRTVYAITTRGRAALTEWLAEPAAPPALESEALVKVFFADAGSLDQLRATLARIAADAAARVEELAAIVDAGLAQPRFPERLHLQVLTLKALFDQELATYTWARWAQQEVAGWRGVSSADHPDPADLAELLAGLVAHYRGAVG